MATATATKNDKDPEVIHVTWALTTADPTGDAVSYPQHADVSWQFYTSNSWGSATAAAQGSHVNTDGLFAAVTNANGGAAITATADSAVKQQYESARYVRPKLTSTGTGAAVTAVAMFRKMPRYP